MRGVDPNFLAGGTDSSRLGITEGTNKPMSFTEWLTYGTQNNFCGTLICYNHDGVPMTPEEEQDNEPCVPILRLYDTIQQKTDTENNHPPSTWRQTNQKPHN